MHLEVHSEPNTVCTQVTHAVRDSSVHARFGTVGPLHVKFMFRVWGSNLDPSTVNAWSWSVVPWRLTL